MRQGLFLCFSPGKPFAMHVTETVLTAAGTLAVSKAADYLVSLGKNKADRTTARESQADGATKTALEALEKALKELRQDVDAEKGRRADAEQTVEMLRVSVDALAERIEEQNRELAAQPKLKAENARLRRQVTELQKQVGDLKARIAGLEQDRAERVTLETELLLAQTLDAQNVELAQITDTTTTE